MFSTDARAPNMCLARMCPVLRPVEPTDLVIQNATAGHRRLRLRRPAKAMPVPPIKVAGDPQVLNISRTKAIKPAGPRRARHDRIPGRAAAVAKTKDGNPP